MTYRTLSLWAFCLATGAVLLRGGTVRAQDVQWRTDYNLARKEAKDKGLPLVVDIGTDNCFWCRRLEETTLRDATVARTLREHFVALKINAERDTALAAHLRITSYPTVVLADAEGKILGTMEGYQDPLRFEENLQRALANVANPEWMVRDYQEAQKAYGTPDYPQSITLLRRVLADGKSRPVQEKARQLLDEIQKQAAGKLAKARESLDKGDSTGATTALTEVVRLYPGTGEAGEAGQMLTQLVKAPEVREKQREQRARELLAQAREDYRSKQYLCCLDRCQLLEDSYGDLQEGAEAVQLSTEIRGNPEWMQSACDNLTDRLSGMYLALAETWLRKGQPQQARICLERVVTTFPGSRQAEVAQIRLSQIQGQATRPVDFQKQ